MLLLSLAACVGSAPGTSDDTVGDDDTGTGSGSDTKGDDPGGDDGTSAMVTLPPVGGKLDYQLGGAYPPPAGVTIVSRDRNERRRAGLYNICYVNGFQIQPDEESVLDRTSIPI